MSTRERDYAYEALAEVTGTNMDTGRGKLNAALKSIRLQSAETDSYLLAAEIHERAKMYRYVMPDMLLTPTALAEHWQRVLEESRRTQATNRQTVTLCPTCEGDRFVLVGSRPVVQTQWMRDHGIALAGDAQHDEYAACPDCNANAETGFFRADGSKFVGMDPAMTRERMRG